MARKLSNKEDLLGLVALGSVIVNLVQAEGKQRIEAARRQLHTMYLKLMERYRQVCREYERLRGLNEQLQREVVALRAENNRLLQEMVAKGANR